MSGTLFGEATYGGTDGALYGTGRTDEAEAVLSNGSTYGEATGGRYGYTRYGPGELGKEKLREPGEYVISLEDPVSGDVLNLQAINSINPVREHTAISDWKATVPYDLSLEEWKFSSVEITFDERIIFQGSLETVENDESSGEATLAGRGVGKSLAYGSLSVTYSNINASDAIRDCWQNYTEFAADVEAPIVERQIDKLELEGTPLEILVDLHEYAGMRFVVDHESEHKRVHSFEPGRVVREGTWTSLDRKRKVDVTGYANKVVVTGAPNGSGGNYSGVATDEQEIEDVTGGDPIVWPDNDPALESNADCKNKAEAILEKRLDEDSLGGSIEITPAMVPPGYAYTVDQWDNQRVFGPYAIRVSTTTDYVGIPPGAFSGLEENGTLSIWMKANWSTMTTGEALPFASQHSDGAASEFLSVSNDTVGLRIPNGATRVRVDAFPASGSDPPDDDWVFLHYGWEYDEARDQTNLYAGHDGEWNDEATISGTIVVPDESFSLSRWDVNLTATLDDFRLWDERLPEEDIEELAEQREIPSTALRSRYQFDEGGGNAVVDAVGGWDGTVNGGRWVGTPLSLEKAEFSESYGEASGTLEFGTVDDLAETLAELQRGQSKIEGSL